MKRATFIILLAGLFACNGSKETAEKRYVLDIALDAYAKKGSDALTKEVETDTVAAPTVLAAYSKGIQKYAAVLMHIQQFPDSIKGVSGLKILDEQGNNVVPSIPQKQRDSVIMNFIQFARRSDIPYYDRVKDFELKLMTAR